MKRIASILIICIAFLTAHTSLKEYSDDLPLIDISKVKGLEKFIKNTVTELKNSGVDFTDLHFSLFLNASDSLSYRLTLSLEGKTDNKNIFRAPKSKIIQEGYTVIDSTVFIVRAPPTWI